MTYGTLRLDGDAWVIDAQPHVAMRLKRLFGAIARGARGKLRISNTPDNARDIEWFCQRYPLAAADADALTQAATAHREREQFINDLLAGRVQPRPFDLAIPPRAYQKVAATMAWKTRGLLLADDVGLGKTCSAITLLSQAETLPALVVTLTHLPRQWADEIKRFCPRLKVHILKKGTPYPLTKRPRNGQLALIDDRAPDVIISNYHKLSGWAEALAGKVRTVVFDECQELRRNESSKYRAAKRIADAAEWRLGLSATPIYNYGGEMHNVMSCIRPGAIGTRTEFLTEWCSDYYDRSDQAKIKNPKAFGSYLRDAGLMLRRTRVDVGRELPELTRVVHHIDADLDRLKEIESHAGSLARLILDANPAAKGEKWRAAEEMTNLVRQATGVAKAPYVADFVRLLVESGERVVLYAWHREVYSILLDRLKDLSPAMYTGSESANAKADSKHRFVSGKTPILIMSLRSGAGLDGLQGSCRTVVFGELDWSPAVHTQAIGRVHRDGQGDPVVAYFLTADSGSDPTVMHVLGVKRGQSAGIVDPYGAIVERAAGGDHVRLLAERYAQHARPEHPARGAVAVSG